MKSLTIARAAGLWLALASAIAPAATVTVVVRGRDGQGLADAAVFLDSAAAKALARPASGVEIGQAHKAFAQRVTVVPVGTAVLFPNRDTVRHHVYSFSPTKTFELKLYAGTPANPVVFDKSGIAVLGCNIHDNMIAWVVVVETPYYGLSGRAGRAAGEVRLEHVAAGTYTLRTWHPGLPAGAPALAQELVVPADGAAVSVSLPLAAADQRLR